MTTAPALLGVQWRVQARHRIPHLLFGLAVPWTVFAALAPPAAPYLLFVEVAAAGVFIAGALAVTDRATGITAALTVSPARPTAVTAARIAPLWTVTVLAAVPVLIAAGGGRIGVRLAAVALTALLLLAAGLGVAHRRHTLMGFLSTVPWPLAPLLAVPLAVSAGLLTHPVWYALPTTGALALLTDTARYPALLLLGYLAAWAIAALGYAVRTTTDPMTAAPPPRRPHPRDSRPSYPRADLRNITREAIIWPIAASPLLLGLLLRLALPPLTGWAQRVHGIDLTGSLPVFALLAVVLHVPVVAGMLGALLVLDDRDDGALRAIRVSPLGVHRYLAYRLWQVTAFAAAGLAIAAPLSGLVPATAWVSCLLAVLLAPTFTLAVLATAGNRVEGVAATKALGLPAYAPIAAWWLTGAAGWAFAPLPTYWIVQTWRGPRPAHLVLGTLCTGLWLLPLARRARRRLAS